jgi:hypothetical protein
MTRRDYVLLSDAIRGMPAFAPALRTARESAARTIANALAAANPRGFDHARFLADCGVAS